ncbi:MAG: fumarylacetoacetate hydrolase family protein [Bdellovibrionales bacterium]|nr:fumarylacetoacetate hydrolase family protein [Bdellovibrionales bacterium]
MKLASLRSISLDGELVVVSKDNTKAVKVHEICPSMQNALDDWDGISPKLQKIYEDLNAGTHPDAFNLDHEILHSPLPRSFAWLDGSAFIQHVKLVRKARGADLPPDLLRVPLMYQGGSDRFLAPTADIPQVNFSHGTDFEGEIAVITNFIPMGSTPEEAEKQILLFVLVNDVSLRGIIPDEIKNGFGFLQGKPASAFSPLAITPDELGDMWKNGRVHLPLSVDYNGKFFGKANAGEMHFSFGELLAHAARTRDLHPGTILGSGTVSNEDLNVGSSCLAEKRMLEIISTGKASTEFMKVGDTIEIKMLNNSNENLFGTIKQKVVSSKARDLPFVR